jgi:hypothetical protein
VERREVIQTAGRPSGAVRRRGAGPGGVRSGDDSIAGGVALHCRGERAALDPDDALGDRIAGARAARSRAGRGDRGVTAIRIDATTVGSSVTASVTPRRVGHSTDTITTCQVRVACPVGVAGVANVTPRTGVRAGRSAGRRSGIVSNAREEERHERAPDQCRYRRPQGAQAHDPQHTRSSRTRAPGASRRELEQPAAATATRPVDRAFVYEDLLDGVLLLGAAVVLDPIDRVGARPSTARVLGK